MYTLAECQSIINQKLKDFEWVGFPINLYDPMRYMLALEGKRIRPALVLMGCNLFTDDISEAFFPALAIEAFHNFTLMHDDIMDKSTIRRGLPTVHAKWNTNIALLAGDAMLIKAYEFLLKTPADFLGSILPVFNQTALKVCEGQQLDMDYEEASDVTIQNYLTMIENKTALLIATSLKMGALIGRASDQDADLLFEFGRNLGLAFQLQDDWLDAFADPKVFGKAIGNDIITNKKTVLLVEALQKADALTRKKLQYWMARTDSPRNEKIEAILEIYKELKLEDLVRMKILNYHAKATECLGNVSTHKERKSEMLAFADFLMNRNK
jgi:geranylgeranyl diphosphate synthase type II